MAQGIDNQTLLNLPSDLEDQLALRNTLLLLVQQIDLIIGLRKVDVSLDYVKIVPSAGYVQSEAVKVADELKALYDKVDTLEARLVPVNN